MDRAFKKVWYYLVREWQRSLHNTCSSIIFPPLPSSLTPPSIKGLPLHPPRISLPPPLKLQNILHIPIHLLPRHQLCNPQTRINPRAHPRRIHYPHPLLREPPIHPPLLHNVDPGLPSRRLIRILLQLLIANMMRRRRPPLQHPRRAQQHRPRAHRLQNPMTGFLPRGQRCEFLQEREDLLAVGGGDVSIEDVRVGAGDDEDVDVVQAGFDLREGGAGEVD